MNTNVIFTIQAFKQSNKKSNYDYEENSFRLNESYDTKTLYIGHQYLTLELDAESGYVIGLSGYFNLSYCERFKFNDINDALPPCDVVATFEENLEPGIGYDYVIPGKSEYDSNRKILKIGNYIDSLEFAQIHSNLILGLRSGKLTCILIKNI